jgi:hypothetical protein
MATAIKYSALILGSVLLIQSIHASELSGLGLTRDVEELAGKLRREIPDWAEDVPNVIFKRDNTLGPGNYRTVVQDEPAGFKLTTVGGKEGAGLNVASGTLPTLPGNGRPQWVNLGINLKGTGRSENYVPARIIVGTGYINDSGPRFKNSFGTTLLNFAEGSQGQARTASSTLLVNTTTKSPNGFDIGYAFTSKLKGITVAGEGSSQSRSLDIELEASNEENLSARKADQPPNYLQINKFAVTLPDNIDGEILNHTFIKDKPGNPADPNNYSLLVETESHVLTADVSNKDGKLSLGELKVASGLRSTAGKLRLIEPVKPTTLAPGGADVFPGGLGAKGPGAGAT